MDFLQCALAAIAILVLVRLVLRPVTVAEYQRGLLYSKGRFVRTLGAGRHWLYAPTASVRFVDVRPRFVTLGGQEVLSADGVTLKVSLAARYEVSDPARAINGSEDYESAFYLTMQMAMRSIVGSATIDELLERRDEFGPRLAEAASTAAAELGLRLISADIKDIMLTGDAKKLFSQIVKARKDGVAALERARGETAALRNLANAAKLMEDNPNLLYLRALQQIGDTSGNTLVLGLPEGARVLPKGSRGRVGPENAEVDKQ